jgi:2-polyprenyl-3-methyl-5-hydroxy-6-metoxy-1,4-benzoquinol methylase
MRSTKSEAAHRAREGFAAGGIGVRSHVWTRQWMAPLDELEVLVPSRGHILDLGCGHGLFSLQLALASTERTVHGVDIDARKIAHGQDAVRRTDLSTRVSLDVVGEGWQPPPVAYDVVVITDVLYLLDPATVAGTVRAAGRALRPGGTLVVKEIDAFPRWKHTVGMTQEFLAVRVLHLTAGQTLNHRPLDTVAEVLAARHWPSQQRPLHRGYHFPHSVLVARQPDAD